MSLFCDAGIDPFRETGNQPRKLAERAHDLGKKYTSNSLDIVNKIGRITQTVTVTLRMHRQRI